MRTSRKLWRPELCSRRTLHSLPFVIIVDLCPCGRRCVAHEAAPEARGGDRVQVQRERAEAAGEDCPSS